MADGLVVGLDFMGPFGTSVGGHEWLLNATEARGYCAAVPMLDKTADIVVHAVSKAINQVRVAVGPELKVRINKIRMHSDRDPTLLSNTVSKCIADQGWEQTTTAGYDHNATARVERKNRKPSRTLRVTLCTDIYWG